MRKLFVLSIVLMLFASCQKEEKETIPENNPPEEEPNYFPMEIGSYWVYENYKIDAEGVETKLPELDSALITKDTLINGETYYIREGRTHPMSQWRIQSIARDSAGYIVGPNGQTGFDFNHPSDTLRKRIELHNNDTMVAIYYLFADIGHTVSVPAGTFEALKVSGHFYMKRDSLGNLIKDERELDYYYSDGIGEVLSTLFYASTDWYFEKRLVRYNIPEPK